MFHSRFLPLVAAGWILGVASPVLGQPPAPAERPERPYRGLFGNSRGLVSQSLIFDAQVGGGYMDVVGEPDETADAETADLSEGSSLSDLGGSLSYTLGRGRFSLETGLGTTVRRFPSLTRRYIQSWNGSVSGSVAVSSRLSATTHYSTVHEPQFALSLFPALVDSGLGPTPVFDPDSGAGRFSRTSHDAGVSVTYALSEHGSASAFYGHSESAFATISNVFASTTTGFLVRHEFAESVGLRLGYEYFESAYPTDAGELRVPYHTIDAGVDYSRSLSFSRRTTLDFSTGSMVDRNADRTLVRLVGDARLSYEIGRSWSANLAYSRGAGFPGALRRPVFVDSVSAGVNGLIGSRVQFHSVVSSARGDSGFEYEESFDSLSGTAGVTLGLTRYFGINVNYTYYRYQFDQGVFLPEDVPPQLDRQTLRASLAIWLPLILRVETGN